MEAAKPTGVVIPQASPVGEHNIDMIVKQRRGVGWHEP
jgi:hypothetical protein